jgi:hypothetical protein
LIIRVSLSLRRGVRGEVRFKEEGSAVRFSILREQGQG